MHEQPWEIGIDVGGTFTDCLAQSPTGKVSKYKLLSSGVTKGSVHSLAEPSCLVDPQRIGDPADFWTGFDCHLYDSAGNSTSQCKVLDFDSETGMLQLDRSVSLAGASNYELTCEWEAPVIGTRYLLGLPLNSPIPSLRLRLGTTKGTNALLTRSGAPTALVTTKGHGDFLHIGYQDRPQLFELTIRKPEPLVQAVVEIDERMAADGAVLKSPVEATIRQQLLELLDSGIESLAICLLHADRFPAHEQFVAGIARALGFLNVSVSSEVAPLTKLVVRGETTVVDAYLNPVLKNYITRLRQALPGSQILMMTSAGGLVDASAFRGYQSVLSGPAGGVVGFAQAAQVAGFERAIGFDMGGTSTDVSRFDGSKAGGAYEMEFESRKAGIRLMTPTLAIDTVAAGGGSICRFDGTKLVVGPESAGADPGPACYGRGGPLCVTDLNFYLGRITTEHFPFHLNREAVERQLSEIAEQVRHALGEELSLQALAEGLLRIANANMVQAARGVSIAKGENPEEYILVSFGGAGSQHACSIARELNMKTILYHPHSGILSAFGIGNANITRHAASSVDKPTTAVRSQELEKLLSDLSVAPQDQVLAEGTHPAQVEIHPSLDLRYQGTDTPINIAFHPDQDLETVFASHHQREFGYQQSGRTIEIVSARVEVIGKTSPPVDRSQRGDRGLVTNFRKTKAWFSGEEVDVPLIDSSLFEFGQFVQGPALVSDIHSTIVVEPGWKAERLSGGEILLTFDATTDPYPENGATLSEAVQLELFNNLFAGIAEQMGHILQRTASSVNVKERLDFSCAVFSAAGELVANAPHVPVHLGAMGTTVRSLKKVHPTMSPGDVFVTNDPYQGGSHLPDITVVSPVHHTETEELLFFTACRAHHAEIGGVRPGSMPPNSQILSEEGVLISNFPLMSAGQYREEELRSTLSDAPYPSRRVEENLTDIRAQVAANQYGCRELLSLVTRYGVDEVSANMKAIQLAAKSKVQMALADLKMERGEFTDYLETAMDKAVPVSVSINFSPTDEDATATIDFSGTSAEVLGNFNATPAIVDAAVLYVLRLLVNEDIPLNEGALQAVDIVLPAGLLNPRKGNSVETTPAVSAGNVETSQRIVDVLLGAMSLAAASQGTMNNVLFGNDAFGYYETVCGGSGATSRGPGADAVQVHMTNTRSTDPEIFERRYPVRLLEFSIRKDSGGSGMNRGGDGVVRKIEFLDTLELSLITGRRGPHPPFGLMDGEPGQLGENSLLRSAGKTESLSAICETMVFAGDILEIRTPGGGGYGNPNDG